jgi:hypothetical protein
MESENSEFEIRGSEIQASEIRNQRVLGALALAALTLAFPVEGIPQVWARTGKEGKPILIHEPIDEGRLIRLWANTRPEANAQNDLGRVEDSFPMEHMLLQLKRAPALEQEFDQYIDSLTDKNSPNFHRWMLAAEQGEKYGLAQQDLDSITHWLESYGFTVDYVYPNQMVSLRGTMVRPAAPGQHPAPPYTNSQSTSAPAPAEPKPQ